ncbi:MAG: membrane protein insertion efficiency factor YidD [Bdellovibrionales bacterium]|nr:membrane protein insertion efficiency factor YidD [Bdellovibrionales bacterium]
MVDLLNSLILLCLRAYQLCVSPALHLWAGPGMGCRHEPSCSEFAVQAIQKHGPLRGARLTASRILRCAPWGAGGWDPVP